MCAMSCVMFMESAQTWGSRARGHSLGQGPTKRVPPLLVARVTRPERALSQGAAEQGEHRADYNTILKRKGYSKGVKLESV